MSFQVSTAPVSLLNAEQDTEGQSANYHPSIWGNYFFSYSSHPVSIDDRTQQEFEGLKQEVRRMLIATKDKASDKLSLIDVVQRLGVAYHFEKEIEDQLHKLYQDNWDGVNNLNVVALRFRLLRQQRYNVPCDIFSKFKDEQRKFKLSLTNDVLGMLSLYEAAHLRIHGEDNLDEAIVFTTSHLKSMVNQVSPQLAEKITHALYRPIRKGLPRLEARYYSDIYSRSNNLENQTLLMFAKLDFNLLQAQHQKELSSLTEWWNSLDFAAKLSYARDRLVELYFWVLGVYFEPQYTLGRRILTKVIAIISVIDDTYDVYGTYDELVLFTEAIERWDISAIDSLPDYMKLVYKALIDIYNEAEKEIAMEGRSYCMDYAIKNRSIAGFFSEAKWCNECYVPTMEEYMKVSLQSTCYKMLETTSFLGMVEIANKQAFDWISNNPKIVVASTVICRFMDDIVSRELEQKRKHVATTVECYMKQHGVSEEEAVRFIRKEISNAWKDVNRKMEFW